MSFQPFPRASPGPAAPLARTPGWNPINPRGAAAVSGADNETCTVPSPPGFGLYIGWGGAVISAQSQSSGKKYAEIAYNGAGPYLAAQAALSPRISPDPSSAYAYGAPGMGVAFSSAVLGGGLQSADLDYWVSTFGLGSWSFSSAFIGVAVDFTAGLLWFSLSGVWCGIFPGAVGWFPAKQGSRDTAFPISGDNGIPIPPGEWFVGFRASFLTSWDKDATATLLTKSADFHDASLLSAGYSGWAD